MSGRPTVEPRIEAAGIDFGAGDAVLLRAVDDHGSLNAATDALGRSFAHAQRRIVELEEAFGTLTDRSRGGSGGGGTTLTRRAYDLLARFDRLRADGVRIATVERTVIPGTVVDRDGELGTVKTAAGPVLALVPDVDAVEVSVRSDGITLHAPDDLPEPGATSARNRFRGTVRSIESGDAIAVVSVDIGTDSDLSALVTMASIRTLDLAVGDDIVSSFKATATRAVPAR